MSEAPLLTTSRLQLHAHILSDMNHFEAFYASDRAQYMFRPKTRSDLWYDFEVASAVLTWAWAQGFDTLTSYIAPENARSIAQAKRLGAVHDTTADLPVGETAEDTSVYRHSPDTDGNPEAYA